MIRKLLLLAPKVLFLIGLTLYYLLTIIVAVFYYFLIIPFAAFFTSTTAFTFQVRKIYLQHHVIFLHSQFIYKVRSIFQKILEW